MAEEKLMTIPKLAELLGVSRITVYNWVKNGDIPATKAGRMYVINDETVQAILNGKVSERRKEKLSAAVRRTVKEYGKVLEMLGNE